MWLITVLFVCGLAGATITGQHPHRGACLCVTGTQVNARNHAGLSGHVVGHVRHPECYTFPGGTATKDGRTWYQLAHVQGNTVWVAGDHLTVGTQSDCAPHRITGQACNDTRAKTYACKIMNLHNTGRMTLAKRHPSGVRDDAYTYYNIRDACAGHAASRSHYTCVECPDPGAPGGHVCLNSTLLHYIHTLATTLSHLHVNEIAGACHTCHSRHYLGSAVDLHGGPGTSTMLQTCFTMGGWAQDEGSHIHCQF